MSWLRLAQSSILLRMKRETRVGGRENRLKRSIKGKDAMSTGQTRKRGRERE